MIFLLASLLTTAHRLEAEKAAYDGRTLSFEGGFHFTHPMGNIKSTSASLNGLNLKHSATQLFLDHGVQVDLPPSEILHEAVTISSQSASCELASQTPLSFWKFQKIEFKKNVFISSERGIAAKGGLAIYKNKQIVLYPELPLLYCQLIHEAFTLNSETIELQFTGENPRLAKILTTGDSEVSFHPRGRLICKGHLLYDPINNTLLAEPQSPLQFTDETVYLEADRAQIRYPDERLVLEGNIRLISSQFQGKETYAIAEKATYSAKENLLILNSSSQRKVLFWQDGFSLTAPEVHVRPDRETVQGVGDIHFAFDLDEQNYFEQIFSKYL